MLAYLLIAGIAYVVANWACSNASSYWRAIPGFLLAVICGWLGGTLILAGIFSVFGGDVAGATFTYLGRGIAIALTGAVFGVSRARSRLAAKTAVEESSRQASNDEYEKSSNGTNGRNDTVNADSTQQIQANFVDTAPSEIVQSVNLRTTADEEEVYAQVAKELESGLIDRGLWARLLAQADGDESQTKALYLKQRAERIFARAVKCVVPSIQAVPIEVEHVEPVVKAAVVTRFVPFAVVESSQLDVALKPVRSKSVALAVTAIVVILGALVLSMVIYFSSKGTPERQMQATAESPSFGTAEVRRQADTPSWKVRALDMIARVERGEIPAIDGSTSRIAPADGNEWATTDTLALESNQIWWMHRTNNVASIFLYLQNQTAMDLSGATLDYQGGPCNGSAPAQTFYLTLAKPILPGGQAVVDLRPDFPIETIGESCLVIKRAWK